MSDELELRGGGAGNRPAILTDALGISVNAIETAGLGGGWIFRLSGADLEPEASCGGIGDKDGDFLLYSRDVKLTTRCADDDIASGRGATTAAVATGADRIAGRTAHKRVRTIYIRVCGNWNKEQ